MGQLIRLVIIDVTGPRKREGKMVLVNLRMDAPSGRRVCGKRKAASVPDYRSKVRCGRSGSTKPLILDGNPSVDVTISAICVQHEIDLPGRQAVHRPYQPPKRSRSKNKFKKGTRQSQVDGRSGTENACRIHGDAGFRRHFCAFRHVAAWPGCEVVAAGCCQPDRLPGAGNKLQPPAVKVLAWHSGLPAAQLCCDEADRAASSGSGPTRVGKSSPPTVLFCPIRAGHPDHRAFSTSTASAFLPQYKRAPIQSGRSRRQPLTGITIMRGWSAGLIPGP